MTDMPSLPFAVPSRILRFLVVQVLVAVNVGWLVLACFRRNIAIRLVVEDGIIQWTQVLFLVLTAFYCFRIVRGYGTFYQGKIIRNIFFLCLIASLVLAGEEISWGQRLLGLKTPEFLDQINTQHEITVHNLAIFQRFRHWLLLWFGLTGLALIYLGIRRYRWTVQFAFLTPPAFFTTAFSLVLISGLGVEAGYLSQWLHPGQASDDFRFWAGRFSEIGELGVAITAFSYTADKVNSLLLRNFSINLKCDKHGPN